MSTEINLFKLDSSFDIEKIKEDFCQNGLIKHDSKTIDKYEFQLFHKEIENQVSWLVPYKELISLENNFNSRNYSALVVIDNKYIISMGYAHFYVSKFSEDNFGLEIAMRILKKEKITLQNTMSYGGTTKREISTHTSNSVDNIASNSSFAILKGYAADTDVWGKAAITCGTSIKLRINKISLKKIIEIIQSLEEEAKKHEKFEIPITKRVTSNEKIGELDQELFERLKAASKEVSIFEQINEGVDFIFGNDLELTKIKATKKGSETIDGSLSVEQVRNFIENHNISTLDYFNEIKIECTVKSNKKLTKNLKYFLDFNILLPNDNKNYFLKEGRWFSFNKTYLERLHKSVDEILLEQKTALDNSYPDWKKFEKRLKESCSNLASKWYFEKYFNEKKLKPSKISHICIDRDDVPWGKYNVEIADVYCNSEKALIHVKKGTPKELNYVIDQANIALDTYTQMQKPISTNKQGVEIDEIKVVRLYLLLKRKTRIKKISDFNSIIFLAKIQIWATKVRLAGMTPEIWVSYLETPEK